MDELGDVSYEFQPLAFETTGAMGAETQKWWARIVNEDTHMGSKQLQDVLATVFRDGPG